MSLSSTRHNALLGETFCLLTLTRFCRRLQVRAWQLSATSIAVCIVQAYLPETVMCLFNLSVWTNRIMWHVYMLCCLQIQTFFVHNISTLSVLERTNRLAYTCNASFPPSSCTFTWCHAGESTARQERPERPGTWWSTTQEES